MQEDGFTSLMLACTRGYLEMVVYILSQGADPNTQVTMMAGPPGSAPAPPSETEGQTALHLAARFGHVDCMGELLLHHCDHTVEDFGGWTAERLAEEEEQIEARNLLQDWAESEPGNSTRAHIAPDLPDITRARTHSVN
jgi:ankyrin repeat protein